MAAGCLCSSKIAKPKKEVIIKGWLETNKAERKRQTTRTRLTNKKKQITRIIYKLYIYNPTATNHQLISLTLKYDVK